MLYSEKPYFGWPIPRPRGEAVGLGLVEDKTAIDCENLDGIGGLDIMRFVEWLERHCRDYGLFLFQF
jgi:hypothetical protein